MSTSEKPAGARESDATTSPESQPRKHEFTDGLLGWITHTDLASHDPEATKEWCAKVLGWTFKEPLPIPGGAVHLFAYSNQGGGAVRATDPPEQPGSIPYVHVADTKAAHAKALEAGAEEMMPPIGFSGP